MCPLRDCGKHLQSRSEYIFHERDHEKLILDGCEAFSFDFSVFEKFVHLLLITCSNFAQFGKEDTRCSPVCFLALSEESASASKTSQRKTHNSSTHCKTKSNNSNPNLISIHFTHSIATRKSRSSLNPILAANSLTIAVFPPAKSPFPTISRSIDTLPNTPHP